MTTPRTPRPRGFRRARWPGLLTTLAVSLALTACGESSLPQPSEPTPTVTPLATPTLVEIAPELLTPLFMLGACDPVVDPELDEVVPGLDLPADAFLLEVTEQNGLVNVRGYVRLTPVLFQLVFRERRELDVITAENEIHESETLFTDGEHRVFLKAAAVCELGSVFIAVIAPEVDASGVPTPSGSPSEPPQ